MLLTTPKADGFFMPAEWAYHKQIWMLWPERSDNWRLGAKPAQHAFTQVALAIAEFEPVTMGVSAAQYENALVRLNHPNIRVVELSSNDAWIRDTGPTFVINEQQETRGIDWKFNAWGGLDGGLYFPWNHDNQIPSKILQLENIKRYRAEDFVLEAGSIHVDGEGTLITTQECLLNRNRNPHLTTQKIEENLMSYLGVEKIIWLQRGLYNDESKGHISNLCCFIRPQELLLAWTDNPKDPNYTRCHTALRVLTQSFDAKDRPLTVHKIPIPDPLFTTQAECAGVDFCSSSFPRISNTPLAASYVNFLMVNGGIVAPHFNNPKDDEAKAVLEKVFPEHKVVTVASREILLGGGGIHCITQQQPLPYGPQ